MCFEQQFSPSAIDYVKNRMLTNQHNNQIRRQVQHKQSEVMKERYSLVVKTSRIGDYVSIAIPKQDRLPGQNYNLVAIIYLIRHRARTIVAVTDLGIISKRGIAGQQNYNSFSQGEFITLHQEAHYPDLRDIRALCIAGATESIEALGKMSLRQMYRIKYDRRDMTLMNNKKVGKKDIKKKRCVCKDGVCTNRCGCKKAGINCGKRCSCLGACCQT